MGKSFHYTVNSDDQNNVEISKNSKGDVTFSVKSFDHSLAKAKDRAFKTFAEIDAWVNNRTVAPASSAEDTPDSGAAKKQ